MKRNFTVIRLSRTNCYLLKSRDGYLLILSGYEGERDRLVRLLQKLNVRFGQITHLLLTHHHDDHSGLVNFLTGKNQDIRVIMHRECAALLRTGENAGGGYINKRTRFISLVHQMLHPERNLRFPPYAPRHNDIIIADEGDSAVRDIGISGSILFTPGHSADSISLLMDDGTLFSGDAAANRFNWSMSRYTSDFMENADEYYRSWEKILSKNASLICPSHGSPFPAERLFKFMGKVRNEDLVQMN